MIDLTEEVLIITSGILLSSILLRFLIQKCKRDCYDNHLPAPANTPEPPRQFVIQPKQNPQPTAPPSYLYSSSPPYYTQQINPYNSYSSYSKDQHYVVYIPPVTSTSAYV